MPAPSDSLGRSVMRSAFALLVYAAALPVLDWRWASLWLATVLALSVGGALIVRHKGVKREFAARASAVCTWLLGVAYALAVLPFIHQPGAARVFGVALLVILIFRGMVSGVTAPRRMAANLAPPLMAIGVGEYWAISLLMAQGNLVAAITCLAVPVVILVIFLYLYADLARHYLQSQDMSDQAQESAREAHEAHRIAVLADQLVGLGHFRIDVKARTSTWSDRIFAIYGLDPQDGVPALGRVMSMFEPADRADIETKLRRAITLGEPYSFEAAITAADGQRRQIVSHAVIERDRDGAVATVFGVIMDVTEDRRREQALAESEARYRMLADRATDLIVRYDTEGVIEFVSPSVSQYGYVASDLVGRGLSDLLHPDDWSLEASVREALKSGLTLPSGERYEVRARQTDGQWVWFEGKPAPIQGPGGEILGVVTVLRDVTGQRAMADELRRKQAEAEAAAIAKSEFLANMSHEIRTPLTGIIGFAGLLESVENLPPTAELYLRRITTSGQALLAIVNDVLDFSKLEAGQIELDPQPFDPRAFAEESLDLIRAEARKRGLALELDGGDRLPDLVLADRGRARQVLLNLLGNAVKFTAQGSVTVSLDYQPEGVLRVAVTDTGVGIPQERLDRLFQRFSQIDGSITREYGGSGLGLAICKGLVEMMGGEIGVISQEGRGSTFWFNIIAPAATAVPAVATPAPASSAEIGTLRLLVVDDVAMNRELIVAMLQPFDIHVREAASGADAVEMAVHAPFDLILMDLQMPGMDGLAATQAIRANAELNCDTPILAVSANVLPAQIEACHAAGMSDHIAKPIQPADLLGKIIQWTSADADVAS